MRRILGAALTCVLVMGSTAAAVAATGSPPMTAPDSVTIRAGEPSQVDVTANDSDPDGDEVAVCRLGPLPRALRDTQISNGTLYVFPTRRAHGTYRITYYACDQSYLTAGTLTLEVRPAGPTFDIRPLDGRDDGTVRLALVNTYKHATFRCEWDDNRGNHEVSVAPRSRKVVVVHATSFSIGCEGAHSAVGASFAKGRRLPTPHGT